jgi:hypothetical protein
LQGRGRIQIKIRQSALDFRPKVIGLTKSVEGPGCDDKALWDRQVELRADLRQMGRLAAGEHFGLGRDLFKGENKRGRSVGFLKS